MKISAKTDIGRVRNSNQDAYACGEFSATEGWAVVCDGMGGASGGDVASNTAVRIISEKVISAYSEKMAPRSMGNMFESAITTSNARLYSMSREDENLFGMGTTVVAAIIREKSIFVAHVGDSRVYVYDEINGLVQLTIDHSIVQEMVDRGEITEEEARIHPRKNIITRALGVGNDIEIDFREYGLTETSKILLCTDGLTNYLDDETITQYLSQHQTEGLAEKLVDAANANGGGDNITVVVVSN